MANITLSIVVPCGPGDEAALQRFLASLETQDFPKEQLEVLVIREGNSEEAKALGIQRARGEIIGLFCTDNELVDRATLRVLYDAARDQSVVGAYTRRYHYSASDTLLSRYFALLGANDPVCWWLGKADRASYLPTVAHADGKRLASSGVGERTEVRTFVDAIPSIGDNGCFIKAGPLKLVTKDPSRHYCIDACDDLRVAGHTTWAVVSSVSVWHRSGDSWRTYFAKRWRYVRELYWRDYELRRWHMVSTRVDWWRCLLFAGGSLLWLPALWTSFRGWRMVPDRAWFLHPVVCFALTGLYACAWALSLPQSSSRRWTGRTASRRV